MAIVLFLLLLLLPRPHGNECKCQTSCKDGGPAIRFPFWQMVQQQADCGHGSGFGLSCSPSLQMDQQPAHCGYGSGFGPPCSPSLKHETWLELPLSVKVLVQEIDYEQQEIHVDNPNKCFPSVNLSSSPFQFSKRLVKNYSLLSCPSTVPLTSLGHQVTCLSSPHAGHLVYAISSDDLIKVQPLLSCVKMYNIPSVDPKGIFDQENSVLSWSEPNCSLCNADHGLHCDNKQHCWVQFSTERGYHGYHDEFTGRAYKTECLDIPAGITKFEAVKDVIGGLLYLAIVISICLQPVFNKLEKGEQVKIERFLEYYRALKPTRYTYAEIKKITNNFKDKLGQGGYGIVYKGKLSDDVNIAAKILNNFTGNGDNFINEVGTIGTIHHINVVCLVHLVGKSSKILL
ncbi:hypothetical protein RHMOL_Rhmol06G0166300 [Rhododendron molle]|uniref:Uncharacterized protein n=1 Tax=Rhododendron molle TaxID=49168 RepID=A0ACC0NCY3_RHOML|nr:hypothetical protein RHMOL_Rhmol06G0166300 [Rhododendron molle]